MENISVEELKPKTVYQGYMTKRSGGKVGNWRKRWFVLTNTKHLHYFVTEKDTKAKGVIDLSLYNEVIDIEGSWSKPFRFNLRNSTPGSSVRTFHFVTSSRALNDEWMMRIMQAITGNSKPPKVKRMSVYQLNALEGLGDSTSSMSSTSSLHESSDLQIEKSKRAVRAVAAYSLLHSYLLNCGAEEEAEVIKEMIGTETAHISDDVDSPAVIEFDPASPFHSQWAWNPPPGSTIARGLFSL
eukprot:TRINITY_DN26493_c0_g1_i1.p1 TRINITY_DN26493_c0_g1~~TRINITY_DN26493_c0_g1_i1.p1  ORF type:complete len:270 (-),score=61.83 TRINITY_DN26493_c0_g1_i1:156-878(-)